MSLLDNLTPLQTRKNPWEDPETDKPAMLRSVVRCGLNGHNNLFPSLVKFCNDFYTLFWDGRDASGNETGMTPVDFCAALGSEGAAIINAFGALCQACHSLQPGSVPVESKLTLHRLPSGWVWPGELEDMPEGWDNPPSEEAAE